MSSIDPRAGYKIYGAFVLIFSKLLLLKMSQIFLGYSHNYSPTTQVRKWPRIPWHTLLHRRLFETGKQLNCWWHRGGMLGVAALSRNCCLQSCGARAKSWQSVGVQQRPAALRCAPSGGCALRSVGRVVICNVIVSGNGYESAACVGIG